MFSRFFIDRPIFAAVISMFLVHRRPRRDAHAADRAVSGDRAAGGHRAARSTRAPRPSVLEQTVAAPLENAINGVEDMIYMSSNSTSAGVVADPGDVRDRHQRRPGGDQRQQPRQAGRAAAAAGSAAPGRHGRARQLVVPAGARVLLAGRPLRRPVHVELRHAQRARRAEAPARHDQRADLRRQGLRDAHLAASPTASRS